MAVIAADRAHKRQILFVKTLQQTVLGEQVWQIGLCELLQQIKLGELLQQIGLGVPL